MKNNIGLFLTKRAHLNPSLEAFIDTHTGLRLTFSELNARSNRTASVLRDLGVRRGDRAALLLMNCPEFLETFFALAKLGAVAVPLNWRLVPAELSFILKDSGARVLVYGGEFQGEVSELQGLGAEATQISEWIHVGPVEDKADFARDYAGLQSAASDEEPEIGACDDDTLYIMYTSGTTGLPKGAVHSHGTAMWPART